MSDSTSHAAMGALQHIERAERLYRLAFAAACLVEALLLGGLLLVMDVKDRTHLMMLIGFVGGYSICVLAIAALGAHVSQMTQKVLRAIAA